ncbi:hypothetical protein V8G54_012640 [Vigna mungo]|uniref:Uncharacterized protein n=1 Tax=Vigna mungo TaxID=3915 RepID=A0AAQ3NS82_VIGMU
METPLVSQKFTSESDYSAVKRLKDVKFVLWTETVKIWKIALPVALTHLFQFLTNSSTSIYAGHLGDIQLSSISVSQVWYVICTGNTLWPSFWSRADCFYLHLCSKVMDYTHHHLYNPVACLCICHTIVEVARPR